MVKKILALLIMPSAYDQQGYVHRFWRGVLPSNSLAVVHSLMQGVLESEYSDCELEVRMFDDGLCAHSTQLRKLENRLRTIPRDTLVIVGAVGVQSRQFPRACDILRAWKKRGATCIIGGFHVSGSLSALYDGISENDRRRPGIPCPKTMPSDIQQIMDDGIIVFHGECESMLSEVVRDIVDGKPRLLYRGGQPSLQEAPLPTFHPEYIKYFATSMGTLDTGRGCPFACSFCTIINVQGRDMRWRNPQALIAYVNDLCDRYGHAHFFFTDDNLARNPKWSEIFDGLIALRTQGKKISFMLEADLQCYKWPDFIEKAAAAGCTQFFMGVESMNPKNLKAARKNQNHVNEYKAIWQRCHDAGIVIHAGYIIGFPYDTPASVLQDIQQLTEAGADQVSLFMLTPLPGSEDHVRALSQGVPMDSDLNRYDSFQPAWDHATMTRDEWQKTYDRAWREIYSVRNMIRMLQRHTSRAVRMRLVKNYVWYRWAVLTEASHPMIAGLYRVRWLRDRRRSDAQSFSLARHCAEEVWRHMRYVGCFFREFYVFQHVFSEVEVVPYLMKKRKNLTTELRGFGDWCSRTFWQPINRRWLNAFWIWYGKQKWALFWRVDAHICMIPYAISEVVYTFRWIAMVRRELSSS